MKAFLCAVLLWVAVSATGAPANIITLNYGNISELYHGDWLAVFHAPWCGHCKALMKVIPDVSKKIDPSVQIALIDASASYPIRAQFHVDSYPTLYHIHDSECRKYSGPRTSEKISEYVNGEWSIADPVANFTAPTSMLMRSFGLYVDVATRMYGVVDGWTRKLGVDTLVFICVCTGLCVFIFGATAIVCCAIIKDARVSAPEKRGSAGKGAGRTPGNASSSSRGRAKGQKVEISRPATLLNKKSDNNNNAKSSSNGVRQRRKKK